eukprot:365545-Chlamydomonas_euryale.AAC.6
MIVCVLLRGGHSLPSRGRNSTGMGAHTWKVAGPPFRGARSNFMCIFLWETAVLEHPAVSSDGTCALLRKAAVPKDSHGPVPSVRSPPPSESSGPRLCGPA